MLNTESNPFTSLFLSHHHVKRHFLLHYSAKFPNIDATEAYKMFSLDVVVTTKVFLKEMTKLKRLGLNNKRIASS